MNLSLNKRWEKKTHINIYFIDKYFNKEKIFVKSVKIKKKK